MTETTPIYATFSGNCLHLDNGVEIGGFPDGTRGKFRVKIVSVEQKIHGILGHFGGGRSSSLAELLDDAASRPELVAIFIGVLELVRMKRLVISAGRDDFDGLEGIGTVFTVNPEFAEDPEAGLVLDDYASAEKTPEENKKNGEETGRSDENSGENSGGNKSEDPA